MLPKPDFGSKWIPTAIHEHAKKTPEYERFHWWRNEVRDQFHKFARHSGFVEDDTWLVSIATPIPHLNQSYYKACEGL